MTELQKPILFLDFDGTISRRDAVDAILETYADPKWLTFEAEWRAGRMGSRDCLRAQMALVRASRKQIDALLDEIGIDEDLVLYLKCAPCRISRRTLSATVSTIAFVAFSPVPTRESPLCCGAGAFARPTLKVAVICGALSFLSSIKPAGMDARPANPR